MAVVKTLRERLEDQITGMRSERQPYEADWEEIARLALPNKVELRGQHNNQTNKRRANTTSHDSGGRIASRRLVNGMSTGLTSSAQPWFKLTIRDRDLAEYHTVKEWLAQVENLVYWLFAKTNYYDSTKMQYADLGVLGVGASINLEHPEYLAVWHHQPVGSYHLSLDEGLRVSRLVRHTRPTVEQVYHQVRGDTSKLSHSVVASYDKGDYGVLVPCVHLIERNIKPNGEYKSPNIRKPWRSIRWEIEQNNKNILLTESGYDSQPFTAPRWETVGNQVYCDTSPGFDALPDLRELQLGARRESRAMDAMVKPPLAAPAGLARSLLSLDPGSVNYIDAQSGDVVKPLLQLDPRLLDFMGQRQQRKQQRINEIGRAHV